MHKNISPFEELQTNIQSTNRTPYEWSVPERFDPGSAADANELNRRFRRGEIVGSIDRTFVIAQDIFEHMNPGREADESAALDFADDVRVREDHSLFLMPWRRELWKFPGEGTYNTLRYSRYNPIITPEEQRRLSEAVTLVGGLSVGSSIEKSLVISGIGGTHVIADFDYLSLTNAGRISGRYDELGGRKIDNTAIATSETNPYIKQVLLKDGITEDALNGLVDAEILPDIMFDAVDNFAVKVMMRKFADRHKIPLAMVTDLGEKSVVDVENYASGNPKIFNGRVADKLIRKIEDGTLTAPDQKALFKSLLGLTNLSPRLLKSSVMKDKGEIAGVPQDGLIAGVGGNIGAFVARQVVLGRSNKSGRYIFDLPGKLRLDPADGRIEQALMVLGALKHTYMS